MKVHQRGPGAFARAALLAGAAALGGLGAGPGLAQDASAGAFVPDASSASASAQAAGPAPVNTTTAAPEQGTQEIVVTGSRIARRDYEANSPIITADNALLKDSSTSAVETNLNKLPQFTPAQTPALGGDIQATATNTPGAATVSLRGLGTNRNLVLLDGRRATPSNAAQVVDINTIPSIAIDRVEVITGGASATYGADAVGGVVNFILKKNFQGLQLDARAGVTQRGDGMEYEISGIMGTNFADGRGNVSLALSTNNRDESLRIDRPWFRKALRDPTTPGTEFFPDFSGYQPYASSNPPSQAVINRFFPQGGVTNQDRIYFNTDGTPFTGFFQSPAGGSANFKGDTTGLKWKRLVDGTLAQNSLTDYAILPLNRYNIYARGNYEVNDWLSVFAQGLFSKVDTETINQPSPSVNGWSALIPNDGRPVPADLQAILNSRANPNGPWQLTYLLNQTTRRSRVDVFTYNLLAGFDGKIPGTDWTWELYGSQGESETSALVTGAASLERFRQIIQSPNWGAGFRAQGNAPFAGFGASTATCASGFDPFNKGNVSADCLAAIQADLKTRSTLQQTVFEFDAQGKLLDLPAGELRAAVGASHRQNRYEFLNDTLTTQGSSFQDSAIGIYPSGNSRGLIKADEAYGELLVPIVRDLPFIHKLDLELGGRYSHYNTTGTSFTYKALGDWQVTRWLRFRGGYNRAERTPNIAELYLAPQQTFVVAAGGDLCSTANASALSANPARNPNAARALALCRGLMDRAFPGTSAKFYSDPTFYATRGPAFAFPTLQGNPNLTPEKADTFTVGTVVSSPFDNPWVHNLRLSVDYYNIRVKDAIGAQSLDIAQRQCFDPAFNPNYDPGSSFCAPIQRVAGDGALGNVTTTFVNNGRFFTSGIDAQLDWAFDVGPGRFSFNSAVTYLVTLKSSELKSIPVTEWAGSLGPNNVGLTPGAFRWKMFNTFGYSVGPVALSLQWQHLPSADAATNRVAPGSNFFGAPAYNLFNLSGTLKVNDRATLRFGVDNLFDKAPPQVEYNSASNVVRLATGGNPINPLFYDVIGRRFYLGANVKF